EGIERGRVKFLTTRHCEAVRTLLDLKAHAPEVLRDSGDAVGLFHPELGPVTHYQTLRAGRAEHRERGNLVDQRGGQAALDRASTNARLTGAQISDQFN